MSNDKYNKGDVVQLGDLAATVIERDEWGHLSLGLHWPAKGHIQVPVAEHTKLIPVTQTYHAGDRVCDAEGTVFMRLTDEASLDWVDLHGQAWSDNVPARPLRRLG